MILQTICNITFSKLHDASLTLDLVSPRVLKGGLYACSVHIFRQEAIHREPRLQLWPLVTMWPCGLLVVFNLTTVFI